MKKAIYGVMPLLLLGLIACGTPVNPSNPEVPSETPSETPTEVESQTTTQPVTANWSEEEQALMIKHVKHVLPYAPVEGAMWVYDESIEALSYTKENGQVEDIELFCSQVLANSDYVDLTQDYADPDDPDSTFRILQGQYDTPEYVDKIELQVDIYDGVLYCDAILAENKKGWDQAQADALLQMITGDDTSTLPAPSFKVNLFVGTDLFELGGCFINLYVDEDYSATYIQQLIEAGYEKQETSEGEVLYVDPTQNAGLMVSYDASEGTVDIDIYPISFE